MAQNFVSLAGTNLFMDLTSLYSIASIIVYMNRKLALVAETFWHFRVTGGRGWGELRSDHNKRSSDAPYLSVGLSTFCLLHRSKLWGSMGWPIR